MEKIKINQTEIISKRMVSEEDFDQEKSEEESSRKILPKRKMLIESDDESSQSIMSEEKDSESISLPDSFSVSEKVWPARKNADIEAIKWVIENSFTEESLQNLSDTFMGGMFESLAGRGITVRSSKELPTSISNGTVQKMNTEGEKANYRMQFSYPAKNQNPADWIRNNFGQLEGALKKAFAAKMTQQLMKSLNDNPEFKRISKKEEKTMNTNFFNRMRVNFIRFFCVHQVLYL